MLLLIPVVAFAISWLFRPTQVVQRYIRALENCDYEIANRLCVGEISFPDAIDNKCTQPRVFLRPLTVEDFLAGRRELQIVVDCHDGAGPFGFAANCVAGPNGITVDPVTMR